MAIHKRPVKPPTSSTHIRPVPQHILDARKEAEKAKQRWSQRRYISGVISGKGMKMHVQKQRISPHLGPGAAFATGVKEAAKIAAAKIAAAKRRNLKEQKNLAAANRAKIAAAKLAAARASRAELIRDAAAIVKAKFNKRRQTVR